jgi:hypothetical protein
MPIRGAAQRACGGDVTPRQAAQKDDDLFIASLTVAEIQRVQRA